MMTIKQTEVTVREITQGYTNNDEQGVRGFGGLLPISVNLSTTKRSKKPLSLLF